MNKSLELPLPVSRVLLKKASLVSRTSPSPHSPRATILSQATIGRSGHSSPQENYVEQFLARFPDYRKALWLAARSEEEGLGNPSYQGWQWSDVEMHPTRVLKLVIEGIAPR